MLILFWLLRINQNKFNKQYNKLKVIRTNKFHDRYIIIDNMYIYHIGTSINYIGEKVFSISKLEDEFVIDNLLNYVDKFLNGK